MKTEDTAHLNVVILQEVHEGIVDDPRIFIDDYTAKRAFEKRVVEKGFRTWEPINRDESFDEYKQAFYAWEDSSDYPYDKMDWEIHIWL